jgi:hypothetical protein
VLVTERLTWSALSSDPALSVEQHHWINASIPGVGVKVTSYDLHLHCDLEYTIVVQVGTAVGMSPQSRSLVVPTHDKRE